MRRAPKIATVSGLVDRTSEDAASGAMRSLQAAEMTLPEAELRRLWTPAHLERLARTYWRFLTRVTLGLVRVLYSESERSVVLLARPLTLFAFGPPEYELDGERGVVRWRIKRGLLVARGAGAAIPAGEQGHLQIEVRRLYRPGPGMDGTRGGSDGGSTSEDGAGEARVRVEVEVANFHPAIASGLGRRVYNATQAKIHVFVTHGFLRSLARLDLAESKVRTLAPQDPAAAEAKTPAPEDPTAAEQPRGRADHL